MSSNPAESIQSHFPHLFILQYQLLLPICWLDLIVHSSLLEMVYNLSEQGKESLFISLPVELQSYFRATREMTHRQVGNSHAMIILVSRNHVSIP